MPVVLILTLRELLVFQSIAALQGEPSRARTGNWASTALAKGAGAAEMASSSSFVVLDGH